MGFFAKLLGLNEDHGLVHARARRVAEGLVDLRRLWFNDCVAAFSPGANGAETALQGRSLVRRSYGSDVDACIVAFQHASTIAPLMQAYRYLPERQIPAFAEAMTAQVPCERPDLLAEYLPRYFAALARGDAHSLMRAFANDILRYLTSSDPSDAACEIFRSTLPPLICFTRMTVADAFGDRATVDAERQRLGPPPQA